MTTHIDRRGLWMAAGSFVMWGLMPLYWHLLKVVPSLQIVAHRIVWSGVLVVAWLCLRNGARWWTAVLAQPRLRWMLALSGVLIGFNWEGTAHQPGRAALIWVLFSLVVFIATIAISIASVIEASKET